MDERKLKAEGSRLRAQGKCNGHSEVEKMGR
jgi:hypothetical protein